MASLSKTRTIAYLALLGNTLVWGLALPIVKRGFLAGLNPTAFLLVRFYAATIFSLPIIFLIRRQKAVRLTFKKLLPIIIIELLGNAFALWLLYEGVDRTSAVESSLISSVWPIFAILGGVLFLKEREQKNELAGLIIATLGTFLLVGRPLITNHINGSSLAGNLLVLGHDLTTVAYVLLAKRFYKGLSLWVVTHISFWVSSLSFTVLAFTQGQTLQGITATLNTTDPWPLIAIIYMAVFGSIIGLTFYLIGQSRIEASEASLFTYLQPAVSIPAAIILLGETIQPLEVIAVTVIVLGVFLAQRR